MVSVHVGFVKQPNDKASPAQSLNVEPLEGVATRVTVVPRLKVAVQLFGQLMPG